MLAKAESMELLRSCLNQPHSLLRRTKNSATRRARRAVNSTLYFLCDPINCKFHLEDRDSAEDSNDEYDPAPGPAPDPEPKPSLNILDLPLDILVLIFDRLPTSSHVILKKTCRVFRYTIKSPAGYSWLDQLEVLAALARTRPTRWVCEDCTKMHHVHLDDVPLNIRTRGCRRPTGLCRLLTFAHPTFTIEHRHVQMALKYARLQLPNENYALHLKRLTKPARRLHSFSGNHPAFRPIIAHLAIFPKIVQRSDGNLRFLLLHEWAWKLSDKRPLAEQTLGNFKPCPHVWFCSADVPWDEWNDEGTMTKHGRTTVSCFTCLTDFSFHATGERAVARVWQDMGGEGSPMNADWQSHNWLPSFMDNENQPHSGEPGISDRATGSIRNLYLNNAFPEQSRLLT
ncbi:hypothetical protein S40293_02138 [Stachybotrys chartarum IBT 40293]|nr:hypothetical protein S40293_02138 [Stachybotrys chartarum IBT 40293]KFA73910.1 hypothetical protein S40288_00944 [Stachybotrys chartarum IBT 40288]